MQNDLIRRSEYTILVTKIITFGASLPFHYFHRQKFNTWVCANNVRGVIYFQTRPSGAYQLCDGDLCVYIFDFIVVIVVVDLWKGQNVYNCRMMVWNFIWNTYLFLEFRLLILLTVPRYLRKSFRKGFFQFFLQVSEYLRKIKFRIFFHTFCKCRNFLSFYLFCDVITPTPPHTIPIIKIFENSFFRKHAKKNNNKKIRKAVRTCRRSAVNSKCLVLPCKNKK